MAIVYIIILMVIIPLMAVVYLKNPKGQVNHYFVLFSVSALFWQSSILLDGSNHDRLTAHYRLLFVAVFWMVYFLLQFLAHVSHKRLSRIEHWFFLGVVAVFGAAALFSDLVIEGVSAYESATGITTEPLQGKFYWLGIAVISIMSFWAALLLRQRLHRPSSIANRTQLQIIYYSLIVAIMFAMTTFVLLPEVFGVSLLSNYTPFSSLLVILALAYVILRHSFLDIRLVVTRTLAYVLSIAAVSIIFFVLASVALPFIYNQDIDISSQVPFLLLALFLAVAFQPLKKYFDRATDQLFYQENYDTQEQIDRLGELVVSEYEIDKLVSSALDLISQSLRPTTGKIILLDGRGEFYDEYRLASSPKIASAKAVEQMSVMDEIVLVLDEYDEYSDLPPRKHKLVKALQKHGVSLAVKFNTKDEIVGYMLLGPKLSGGVYNSKDAQFSSTAAKELAIAIQNARRFDQIQRFNDTLKLEVERATAEIRKSNKKLLELDQAKDEFITMASHQLRTPLTSVKGYVSMVMEGDAGKITAKQRKLLSSAFTSSQRMVYLIGDLLNVSRLQTGKFVIEPTPVDLTEIVANEIQQLSETAKNRKIKLKFNKLKDFPIVMLDENKIRQVIMNFIDNAIYYTPNGGTIILKVAANSKKIDFTVTDDGIGVPKQEQQKLFNKFYRAANARKARPDGTGLGLFMAKKVVVDQGGSIVFNSKEGKGSTFGFTFPYAKIKLKEDQAKYTNN